MVIDGNELEVELCSISDNFQGSPVIEVGNVGFFLELVEFQASAAVMPTEAIDEVGQAVYDFSAIAMVMAADDGGSAPLFKGPAHVQG